MSEAVITDWEPHESSLESSCSPFDVYSHKTVSKSVYRQVLNVYTSVDATVKA